MIKKFLLLSVLCIKSVYAEKADVVKFCADKKSVEKIFESAKKNNKLVVIDFFAEWCGPCKMMAPTFARLAEDMQETCVFAKVDVDQNKETAKEYKIQAMPTIIIAKEGKELGRIVGSKTYAALKEQIESYSTNTEKKAEVEQPSIKNEADLQDELLTAVQLCDCAKIQALIKQGADINKPFYNQLTPLVMAVIAGTQQDGNKAFEVITILLDAGAVWDENVIPGKKTTLSAFVQEMKQGYEKVIENCDFVLAGLEKRTEKKK